MLFSAVQASGGDIGARAGARARSSPNGPIRALTGAQGPQPPPGTRRRPQPRAPDPSRARSGSFGPLYK